MGWTERHCTCPVSPLCDTEKRYQGLNFIGHLREEEYDDCKKMLRDIPKLDTRMTWDSIFCSGAYGMEVWRRIGYILQEEPKFSTRPGFKEIALLVIDLSCNGNKTVEALCKMRFALSSDHGGSCWADVLEKTIKAGVLPYTDKAEFLEPRSPAFIEIWSQWTDQINQNPPAPTGCCICMDSPCNAIFYPCTHSDFCFECSKDLTVCPLCRTEGYSKLRQS